MKEGDQKKIRYGVEVRPSEGKYQRIHIEIYNKKQPPFVFVPGTIAPESRNKNHSAPIGSMGNYLLSAERIHGWFGPWLVLASGRFEPPADYG